MEFSEEITNLIINCVNIKNLNILKITWAIVEIIGVCKTAQPHQSRLEY